MPQILSYQGRVAVGTVNFNGSGAFKFALVNAAGSTTYWSNDGSSSAGSQPTAAVSLPVTKGLYSVLLGDTSLANMKAIPTTVFANSDVRLRVWFDDGANGSQLLTPDQRLAAVGYAMVAGGLAPGATTPASALTGTITGGQLASDLTLSGTTTGTFSGDGSGLRNLPSSANTSEPPTNVFPAQGMVWIKPGTFLMGCRVGELGRSTNETQHPVILTKGFWMGVHEVTQAEYVAVIGSNPSYFQTPNVVTNDTNRPVEQLSWTSAVAYCTALTTAERTAGRIPATWEYRLPTEAEWEYCCRAGARTTRFGYGDDLAATSLGDYAWYSANSGNTTLPVEQKRPNAWRLMDMHGNVFEWCLDSTDGGITPVGARLSPIREVLRAPTACCAAAPATRAVPAATTPARTTPTATTASGLFWPQVSELNGSGAARSRRGKRGTNAA